MDGTVILWLISFLPFSEFHELPTISRFNRLIQFVSGGGITRHLIPLVGSSRRIGFERVDSWLTCVAGRTLLAYNWAPNSMRKAWYAQLEIRHRFIDQFQAANSRLPAATARIRVTDGAHGQWQGRLLSRTRRLTSGWWNLRHVRIVKKRWPPFGKDLRTQKPDESNRPARR